MPRDRTSTDTGLPVDPNMIMDAQVPIEVSEEQLEELSVWLQEEIHLAKADRTGLEENIERWAKVYEAEPEQMVKDWPWPGASNLIVPVAATAVEAVYARIVNAVFGARDLWVGTPRSAQWADVAHPIGKFLNWVAGEVMHLKKSCSAWFLGAIKYGTGVMKLSWDRRVRNTIYRDGSGGVIRQPTLIYDAPRAEVVPLQDFFVSSDAVGTQDIQQCTWCGYRTHYSWKELKDLEASGVFYDVDRIKDQERTVVTGVEAQTQEFTGHQVSRPEDYEIFEIYASYPLDSSEAEDGAGDAGMLYELIINIEPETGTILRAVYNFYLHQERPFHVIRYFPRDDSLYGIGMIKMLEHVQSEVTGMHNRRNDNATIANTRAWKKRRGSLITLDTLYPGAMVPVDEMDDLSELKLGDVYGSTLQEEYHTIAIGEKRTGVSDYTVGRESAAIGSRATATSTMALLREGNTRFQLTIQDIRDALANIGHQILMLYQQFSEDDLKYELFSEKEKRYVAEYFNLPEDQTRTNIHLDTPAVSENLNKEISQQVMMTLIGVVKQFYDGMFEAVAIMTNPEVPEPARALAMQGAQTGSKIFQRLLEAFDFADAEAFAPDIEELLMGGQNAGQQLGGVSPFEGGGTVAGSPVAGQQPPMDFNPFGTGAPAGAGSGAMGLGGGL